MKNWRIMPFLMGVGILIVRAPTASALIIPIRTDWLSHSHHFATPGYVWQNDPEVLKVFESSSPSNFCTPAAIGSALLNQFAYQSPRALNLKLQGYTEVIGHTPTLDTAKLLLDLVSRCNSDFLKGTLVEDGVKCAAQLYRESGYKNAKVRLIRVQSTLIEGVGIEHENRVPTLEDLRSALSDGYQVIGTIAMIRGDSSQQSWIQIGSHSLNFVGLAEEKNSISKLFVTNPTRSYQIDGLSLVYDEATIEEASSTIASALPKKYSPLLIAGRLLTRPDSLTVLSGLLLLRTH